MEPDPVAAGASSSPPPSPAPATATLFPDHQIAAMEPDSVAAGASSSPPPSSPAPATSPLFPDHQIVAMEPRPVAAGASSSLPPSSPAPATSAPSSPAPATSAPSSPAPATSAPSSPAPAATSPPSSPAPTTPPPRQTRDDEERGAAECANPGGDMNSAPPPSPTPQQAAVEDSAVGGDVEQEEPDREETEGGGEALRSFMQEFGDQGGDSIILSSRLKEISTPDRPAALCFLAEKYNNIMERYKKQVVKCYEQCEPRYNDLKKKYTDECAERRRLYNELIELRGNIRVFCRCRPLSSDEVSRGCLSVVKIDPSQETELQFVPSEKERKPFKFDHVFGPEDNQETVFSETVPVIRSVMDGFNVCIFAYGQTGTGKTFTMEGVPENRGVNYRALEELFRMAEKRSTSVACTFSVSILEVYNEKIRDLLDGSNDQSKRLDIKQNVDGTQEVHGLIEAPVYNIDGVWEKLRFGAQNRSVGSTNANELSSRSHSLVRVTVRSEHLVTYQRSRSHMWLVDLAGSERIAKTGVEGERLKEAQFINKSLSALGDVISALAAKNSHIPYRNSKLTHLLQSSLGGDCKTLMFVQISPSSMDSGETLTSLNFASRVRSVEHGPARKQVDPAETLKFKQMTEKLLHEEKEKAQLNQRLHLMQLKYVSRENVFKTLNEKLKDTEQACRNYQQRIRELENELCNEKRASRDSARSSRPPLVPPRQRQSQGRNNSIVPPSGPSRWKLKPPTIYNKENIPVAPSGPSRWKLKPPTIHNKENIPVAMNKSNPVDDPNKAVGRARRVSLTPVIRQIPIQPKRRSSMAVLPSVREAEHLSVLNEKRAGSRLSQVHMPRRSVASFGVNLVPGTPLAGHGGPVDATPDAAKLRRFDFGSSSKFTSPPPNGGMWNKMVTPQQKLGMAPAGGPVNSAKLCFSIQKRVTPPSFRAQPTLGRVQPALGIFDPAVREHMAGTFGKARRVLNTKRRQSVI